MLIIPVEDKPDWSSPPLITLALVAVNLLVFLFYQGNDDEIAEDALHIYHSHNLIQEERDHYLHYLRIQNADQPEVLAELENESIHDEHLIQSLFYDRGFDQYLEALWQQNPAELSEATLFWRNNRALFEQQRNRLSSIAAGLTPAEAKPWTFFTSLFLHGGWAHLMGNMVFLFLFGFALETVLRPQVYLGMYFISGIAASALFAVLNTDSYIPLVGASGAISGLMGMYLALYQLRRIRFFYTVFFYFGEFRAPALLVLPLWLAKELYGHFFVESNTAYWAHIGGLLAGAALMLLARQTKKDFTATQACKTDDNDIEATLKKIQLEMAKLEYSKARSLARLLCQRHPEDPRPWHMLFDLHKIQPNQEAFQQVTGDILKQFTAPGSDFSAWQPHIETMLRECTAIAAKAPDLSGQFHFALAKKHWDNGAHKQAEDYLQLAQKSDADTQAMLGLLEDMHAYYQQQGQRRSAARLAIAIEQLQP